MRHIIDLDIQTRGKPETRCIIADSTARPADVEIFPHFPCICIK